MIVWFIITKASCVDSLHKVHPTTLIKVFKVAVFNGSDESSSPVAVGGPKTSILAY